MEAVYVTGMGIVSALGSDVESWWQALCRGESGQGQVTRFSTDGIERDQACEVKGVPWEPWLTRSEQRQVGRAAGYALAATRQALEQAGHPNAQTPAPERRAVVVGTSMGEGDRLGALHRAWFHGNAAGVAPGAVVPFGSVTLPALVARSAGCEGPIHTVPGACAAGNYALGLGAELIRTGHADLVIAGASEVIERLQYAGFARLGAIAPQRCQPFDAQRKGLMIGEGAAFFVLESAASVVRRGGQPLAQLGVLGLTCDAFHITRPHPEGAGSRAALLRALSATGLAPDAVDYFCAHGTGTEANDAVEAQVLRAVFGTHVPLVSSLKGAIGHAMGAASAIEAVACVQALRTGVVPGTVNLEETDPALEIDVLKRTAHSTRLRVVLNNSLAFGGYNAVLPLINAEDVVLQPDAPASGRYSASAGIAVPEGAREDDAPEGVSGGLRP